MYTIHMYTILLPLYSELPIVSRMCVSPAAYMWMGFSEYSCVLQSNSSVKRLHV